ncbi:hypothetical protein BLNAU_13808 [Blattamonas nauphoetae]|uniref:RING-CH-type domain-containing protein n=1 Tax=Blattamonas nauphoetae TaxID=2049346 RepID=A0ABQ9XKR5_9EUKA|nr:hypothetical protein BLNAU_13808 [Blattamonas nauphoetae]
MAEDQAPVCKICLMGDEESPLYRPCQCAGSIGYVHMECLSEWLQSNRNNKENWLECEICHTDYQVDHKLQPICRWHRYKPKQYDIPALIFSTVAILILLSAVGYAVPLLIYYWFLEEQATVMTVFTLINTILIWILCLMIMAKLCGFHTRRFKMWANQNNTYVPRRGVPRTR